MAKIESPCLGCQDRKMGCHNTCDKYLTYRKALDEYNSAIREMKYQEGQAYSFRKQQIEKAVKHRRK